MNCILDPILPESPLYHKSVALIIINHQDSRSLPFHVRDASRCPRSRQSENGNIPDCSVVLPSLIPVDFASLFSGVNQSLERKFSLGNCVITLVSNCCRSFI